MIALRGIVERSGDGRSYTWKGLWAFGSDVPAASPAALPFEYTWQRPVDPATIVVPSAALQNDDDEEMSTTAPMTTGDEAAEGNSEMKEQNDDAKDAAIPQENQIIEAKEIEITAGQDAKKKEPDTDTELESNPAAETTAPALEPTSAALKSDVPVSDPLKDSLMETPVVKRKKKLFTFADPMTPGDPQFTDASSTHGNACPPSGEWKGFFETLPRKSAQSNVPVHEHCYLFLNATPPADALIQFWDESQPPDETAKLKLPDGHVFVRGMGENQYGKFEIIGSYNLQSHLLTCQRIYVIVPPPKSHRKRASSTGSGVGSDDVSPSTGRPYRTRNKQTFSWKQRLEENTNTQATGMTNSSGTTRRKRSRSEGTYGSAGNGGKRLRISIPDQSGSTGACGSSALTPGSVGSEGTARPSPRGMSVHVARKSNALSSTGSIVGNGSIKLSSAGEPSKAQWRAAHFLYYHRDAPAGAVTPTADGDAAAVTAKAVAASNSASSIPKAVVYEGEMHNGQRDGRGICLFNNGMMYEGSWRRNKEHGQGILMTADRKRVIYKGDWEKGRLHGHGVYCYGTDRRAKKEQKLGARYEGEFKENLKHGTGKYYFADGSVYDGSWRDGMMAGRGVFTWPDGSIYEGEWKDSKRHGQGILKASDGFFYDGAWAANAMEGRGTAVYPNGQKYIGLFVCGRREGRGTMLFTNGATYEGRFRDDAIDGQGTLRLSRAMVVPREKEGDEDEVEVGEPSKPDFMIPLSFQSDMGHIHRTAGFTLGGD